MHDLVIYGAGGLGREVAAMVCRINRRHQFWNLLGCVDDGVQDKTEVDGCPLLGGMDFIRNFGRPLDVALTIAKPSVKRRIFTELKECPHVHLPAIIDETSLLPTDFSPGEGCIISPYCAISSNVRIGSCVFFNTGTLIGHDAVLGDFCSLMCHVDVAGNVNVGEDTLIGDHACILQGLRVGARATVGMGSIVMTPVPDDCTVLGNPARRF